MGRRGKKYIGGKYLGEGLYGCAFTPPLACKHVEGSKDTKTGVGKITSPEDAAVEYSISNVLSSLKNADKYFILASSLCIPEPRVKQVTKDISLCKPLANQDITKKAQLIMPLGGKPLRMVPHTPRSIRYFSFCQHLLEAGSLLLIGNIVHNDLHVMNILCDSPSSSKIIDFGLSWSPTTLTPETAYTVFRTFNPSISQESPELTYIFGLEEYDETQTTLILANIQDRKPTIQLLYKLLGIKPEVQIQELTRFASDSISFKNKNWYSVFKTYWSKFDAWAIGTVLLTLFVDMSMSTEFESSIEYKQKAKSALKTIKGLCECDPGKRLDAIQALALWAPDSELLKTPDVQSWLEHVKLVH